MIYRFVGVENSDKVNLMSDGIVFAQCNKGQLLVNANSDYKNCEIIDLKGSDVEVSDFENFYFVPADKTEEFERTREFDFSVFDNVEKPEYLTD